MSMYISNIHSFIKTACTRLLDCIYIYISFRIYTHTNENSHLQTNSKTHLPRHISLTTHMHTY
uniref:Uncharacterized protein n=1 Tax=Glossina morsitans morsitans TaxID=37546 RepID=A0A1B0FD04_GLOMM